MKKIRIFTLCCAALMILQMTGCSSADETSSSVRDFDYYADTSDGAPAEMNGMAYEKTSAESGYTSSSGTQNDLSARKIIKNASLSFETTVYDEFMTELEQCIAGFGGYIESSESYGSGIYNTRRSRSSHITARIPESNYNKFMSSVCTIGTVTYKTEYSNDVTMSYVDTESHIKALETEYEALLEILDKAVSLDDVIQLQSRISDVTYQLDSYRSQLRKYDDLISYCTINIDISEVWRETQNEEAMSFGERIVSGLQDTFYDIGISFTDFSVWLITSLPYIIIWAVVIAVVFILARRIYKKTKRKREQKIIDKYCEQINENSENKKNDQNDH